MGHFSLYVLRPKCERHAITTVCCVHCVGALLVVESERGRGVEDKGHGVVVVRMAHSLLVDKMLIILENDSLPGARYVGNDL